MSITEHQSERPALAAAPLPGASPPVHSGSTMLRSVLVGGDVIALGLGWLVVELTVGWRTTGPLLATSPTRVLALTAIGIALLRRQRLYRSARSSVRTAELAGLTHAGGGLLAASVILDQFAGIDPRWRLPAFGATLAVLLLILHRTGYRSWLGARRATGDFRRPVLIVGTNDDARRVHRLLLDHPDSGFESLGVVGDRATALAQGLGDHWYGDLEALLRALDTKVITGVILVATSLDADETNMVVRAVQGRGGHVHVSSGIAGIDHRRFSMQPIAHEPLLYLTPPQLSSRTVMIKRVIDVGIASVGLLLLAPVLALAALAIKLGDGGPVMFRQRRVGRDGREFTIFKFRTMVQGAEGMIDDLADGNERQGPLFKLARDPRVTRVGAFLRAADIDELPQLFNVVRGDMSLVGPRPALPHEVVHFGGQLQRRMDVLPGITGLWQVESRDNPSFEAYERLDVFYVENWSVTLDVFILFLTAESELRRVFQRIVQSGDGAPAERIGPQSAPEPLRTS